MDLNIKVTVIKQIGEPWCSCGKQRFLRQDPNLYKRQTSLSNTENVEESFKIFQNENIKRKEKISDFEIKTFSSLKITKMKRQKKKV